MFLYEFQSPILFQVQGPDAERYLQSRLSNDIRLCTERYFILAGALNSQGKVQALFRVWRDGDSFLLLSDGGDLAETREALLQFKVADRLELTDLSALHGQLYLQAEPTGLTTVIGNAPKIYGEVAKGSAGVYSLATHRLGASGFDLVLPSELAREIKTKLEGQQYAPLLDFEYHKATIEAGILSLPEDLIDRLLFEGECRNAASFKKGCYVGQEVLERIDSHGKIPRILFSAELDASIEFQPGEKFKLDRSDMSVEVVRSLCLQDIGRTLLVVSVRNQEFDVAEQLTFREIPFRFLGTMKSHFSEEK